MSLHSFYSPSRVRVTTPLTDKLVTKQSMAAECDINNILKQFSKTGIINHINKNAAQYINLPDNMDFQDSIRVIDQATEAFASLPSKVREYYKNDPGRFLAALQDPSERDQLTEFGIFKKPPPSPPVDRQPATTSADPAAAL